MGEIRSHFNLLSYEMVVDIFDYLSHAERKKCRLVCHLWRILLDNTLCGKYFSFRSILNNLTQKQFFNSYRRMESCTMKNFTGSIPENGYYPKILHAIIGWRNSEQNIINFLKFDCGGAKSLTITRFSLGQCVDDKMAETLKNLTWGNLSRLNLKVIFAKYKYDRVLKHVEATSLLLNLARIPHLVELDFELIHKYEPHRSKELRALRFQNMILAFYEFLANHAKFLKSLNCVILTTRRPRNWFVIPEISEEMRDSFVTNLKLREISLKFYGVKRIEAMIIPELFGSQLKSLGFDTRIPERGTFPARWRWFDRRMASDTDLITLDLNFNKIFANNGKSLQKLAFVIFQLANLSWFHNCSALTSVEIKPHSMHAVQESPSPCPTNIFEQSAKFLKNISLINPPMIDLSWFKNCVNLEFLRLETFNGVAQKYEGLEKLPLISLKKLRVCFLNTNQEFGDEFQEFINRCGTTLEELVIYYVDFLINLRECVVLKRLEIRCRGTLEVALSSRHQFPHSFLYLTSLSCCLTFSRIDTSFINWLMDLMPNLESIGVFDFDGASALALKQLFRLPKLVEIIILLARSKLDEIISICETTDGLSCAEGKVYCVFRVFALNVLRVFADRSVYVNPF